MFKLLDEEKFGNPEITYYWYQTEYINFEQINPDEINEVIINSKNNSCHFFYTNIKDKDMLNEEIRTMIAVKKDELGKVLCNINTSDSKIAQYFKLIVKINSKIENID